MSKKPKLKPVPEESLQTKTKSKFPKGNTVFVRPVPAEKWEWSVRVGAKNSLPEDRFYIGRVVRKGKIYVAYSCFFKHPMDCYTMCEDAVAFLKERYDNEKMLESTLWKPDGWTHNFKSGGKWSKLGVKKWNPS